MLLNKTKFNKRLVDRIDSTCRVITMIVCVRYAVTQKQYRLSSLSQKCSKYVKRDKKYKSSVLVIGFNSIDRIMTKLKRTKLEIEIV